MIRKEVKTSFLVSVLILFLVSVGKVEAHRSGCHRWHSCPSDSGSYTCGDAGYPCQYPTYPASGGVIYPSTGYYKDCYDCPLKRVPENDPRVFKRTLKRGSLGSDVASLQEALTKEGLFSAAWTGYYGELTESAVKAFQKKYGVVSSGSPSTTGYGAVGWETMSKLNELYHYK